MPTTRPRYRINSAVSSPGAKRLAPARQALEDFHAGLTLKEARRAEGARVAARVLAEQAAKLKEERRQVGARIAKDILDKMKDAAGAAAGETPARTDGGPPYKFKRLPSPPRPVHFTQAPGAIVGKAPKSERPDPPFRKWSPR